ncbi:MAG: hypothetical protein AAF585_21295, partial [Verrucomicrobiota bacterium]
MSDEDQRRRKHRRIAIIVVVAALGASVLAWSVGSWIEIQLWHSPTDVSRTGDYEHPPQNQDWPDSDIEYSVDIRESGFVRVVAKKNGVPPHPKLVTIEANEDGVAELPDGRGTVALRGLALDLLTENSRQQLQDGETLTSPWIRPDQNWTTDESTSPAEFQHPEGAVAPLSIKGQIAFEPAGVLSAAEAMVWDEATDTPIAIAGAVRRPHPQTRISRWNMKEAQLELVGWIWTGAPSYLILHANRLEETIDIEAQEGTKFEAGELTGEIVFLREGSWVSGQGQRSTSGGVMGRHFDFHPAKPVGDSIQETWAVIATFSHMGFATAFDLSWTDAEGNEHPFAQRPNFEDQSVFFGLATAKPEGFRLRLHPGATRIRFPIPELDALPSSNRGLSNFFDADIPYLTVENPAALSDLLCFICLLSACSTKPTEQAVKQMNEIRNRLKKAAALLPPQN